MKEKLKSYFSWIPLSILFIFIIYGCSSYYKNIQEKKTIKQFFNIIKMSSCALRVDPVKFINNPEKYAKEKKCLDDILFNTEDFKTEQNLISINRYKRRLEQFNRLPKWFFNYEYERLGENKFSIKKPVFYHPELSVFDFDHSLLKVCPNNAKYKFLKEISRCSQISHITNKKLIRFCVNTNRCKIKAEVYKDQVLASLKINFQTIDEYEKKILNSNYYSNLKTKIIKKINSTTPYEEDVWKKILNKFSILKLVKQKPM